jgi:hypothetical protein
MQEVRFHMTVTKITKHIDKALFQNYYRPDRLEALRGLPNLKCMFCGVCSPIPFDMDLHLYEMHKRRVIFGDFPFRGGMDERIDYLLELMKQEAVRNRRYFGCKEGEMSFR